jgi:hypothetical protein
MAKACTRSGQHAKARESHNDAQILGESVVKMIPEANSIIQGAEQYAML